MIFCVGFLKGHNTQHSGHMGHIFVVKYNVRKQWLKVVIFHHLYGFGLVF